MTRAVARRAGASVQQGDVYPRAGHTLASDRTTTELSSLSASSTMTRLGMRFLSAGIAASGFALHSGKSRTCHARTTEKNNVHTWTPTSRQPRRLEQGQGRGQTSEGSSIGTRTGKSRKCSGSTESKVLRGSQCRSPIRSFEPLNPYTHPALQKSRSRLEASTEPLRLSILLLCSDQPKAIGKCSAS